ncbi:MAG: rhomboid family intramembrane serine protease [Leptospirales bacterium]|nr:rhomboid family intramembrane serine protease [Leptospirales bacterium]
MRSFSGAPPATRLLVYLNVAIFLISFLVLSPASGSGQAVFQTFGLVPDHFWRGAFWQPLTSIFLHGGLLHLAFNMIGVWSIGSVLERGIGTARFLGLYFFSGILGSLAVAFFQPMLSGSLPEVPTVGASGALLGLLGAIAILHPNSMMLVFFFPVRARTAALLIGLLSVGFAFSGMLPGISHLGHLGGLIGGAIYTWLAISRSWMEERIEAQHRQWNDARGVDPREEILRNRGADGWAGFGQRNNPWRENAHPHEKVINPMPGDGPQQSPRKRIYFDPLSGRYIVIYR